MRDGMQVRSMATQWRTDDAGGERVIEGYFAVFNTLYNPVSEWEETIAPGAFDGQTDGDVRALINHDSRLVLGRVPAGTLTLRQDERGLWGRIVINPDDSEAMNAWARVKRGDVSSCSFGFDILDEDRQIDDITGKVRYIVRKVKLYEVSVVTFPAYTDTAISARSADAAAMRREALDKWKDDMRRRIKHGA